MVERRDFRDMRSGDPRVFVEHHVRQEPLQNPAVIHPGKSMMMGWMRINGIEQPHISLYAACEDFGVCLIPTADELEAAGTVLLDMAERMRKAATAEADALIARVRNGQG